MTVEITITWNFLGDGEDAHVTYRTPKWLREPDDAERDEADDEFPQAGHVVPLGSSVLAPGLSMPVAPG